MSTRLISATLLSATLMLMGAGAVVADHGRLLEGEGDLSGGGVLLALITSFLAGLICYSVMVWDPQGTRK